MDGQFHRGASALKEGPIPGLKFFNSVTCLMRKLLSVQRVTNLS